MTYNFTSSKNSNVGKQILIALAGTTGSGKTESSLRIARGIVGEKGKLCVIDTEHGRALNKKGRYEFDHLDLQPPFSPENFAGALDAAIKAGYEAIVIDNFSLEWAGEGGCLDMQEEALRKMSGGDFNKAKGLTALAWSAPKQKHKQLMQAVLRCPVPLIFCLRAEPKIKFEKDSNGRNQVVDAGWLPITEKMFAYDMLVYALLMPENPGVPVHLKQLEPELAPVLPKDRQITEEAGVKLAAWAAGGEVKKTAKPADVRKNLVASFAGIGVTSSQIEAFFEKSVDGLTDADISSLRSIYAAIKNEGMTWTACTNPPESPDTSEVTTEGEDEIYDLRTKINNRVAGLGGVEKLSGDSRRDYANLAEMDVPTAKAFLELLG